MAVDFRAGDRALGVRDICQAIFDELALHSEAQFAVASKSRVWRRNYQPTFAAAVAVELDNPAAIKAALARFRQLSNLQRLEQAFAKPRGLKLISVSGDGSPSPIVRPDGVSWLADAELRVRLGAAEPGLLIRARALDELSATPELPVLLAFGGAAELAPTKDWLRWGGRVLVLARSRPTFWRDLIDFARTTAGELIVPIADAEASVVFEPAQSGSETDLAEAAGFDFVEQPDLAAAALGALHQRAESVLFGHFGYAPAIAHLRMQAVAEMLSELAMQNFAPDKLHFSWLATPSDSIAVPLDLQFDRILRFRTRPLRRKFADLPWQLFGQLRKPKLNVFEQHPEFSLLDASTSKQGPSYSLAKRLQRWRAQLAAEAGFGISYQITPPAKTRSVLAFKVLRATYRGAPRFGTHPFEVTDARIWPAALSALDCISRPKIANLTDVYLPTAIHGGLWRTPYETDSAWYAATLRGAWLGLGAPPLEPAPKL